MRANTYSKFCTHIFGKLFSRNNKKENSEKNILLAQANILMDYETYNSMALMNTIIGFISALLFSTVLYGFYPSVITILLVPIIPLMVGFSLWMIYRFLPSYRRKRREKNIDLFLPYAVNFISSMAVAGISPAEIFQSISAINMYGEIQKEAKKITNEIMIMGVDSITALKHAIEVSPSKKLRSFLQGIIGTIQSGSDLHSYLSNVADKYMKDDLVEREKDLDLLSVIVEVFVISVIAFPIFLVIIFTVMGFFGGSMATSLVLLLLFSFIILPIAYVGFYALVRSTSLEEINRVKSLGKKKLGFFYQENKKTFLILMFSIFVVTVNFLKTSRSY
jgi:archaellum biogenesis protein FlaJ (TadC family)